MDKRRVFRFKANSYSGGPDWPRAVFTLMLERTGFDPANRRAMKDLVAVDVGAGTGKTTFPLADLGCTVIAVEPNEPMRERLVALKGEGGYGNVIVTAGDALSLRVPEEYLGRADLVYAANAAHWWSSKMTGIPRGNEKKVVSAWGAVAKQDAKVAIVYLRSQENDPFVKELHNIIMHHFGDVRHIPTESTVRKVLSVGAFGDYFAHRNGKPEVTETYGNYDFEFSNFEMFSRWLLNLSYMPDDAFMNENAVKDFKGFYDRAIQRGNDAASVMQGLRLYTGLLARDN